MGGEVRTRSILKGRIKKSKSGQKSEVHFGQLKSETHDDVNWSPGPLDPVTLQRDTGERLVPNQMKSYLVEWEEEKEHKDGK